MEHDFLEAIANFTKGKEAVVICMDDWNRLKDFVLTLDKSGNVPNFDLFPIQVSES
jgi:hypothetical protein